MASVSRSNRVRYVEYTIVHIVRREGQVSTHMYSPNLRISCTLMSLGVRRCKEFPTPAKSFDILVECLCAYKLRMKEACLRLLT